MKVIGLVLVSLSFAAQAALPPFYESSRQIKAVLDSEAVAQAFGSATPIESVEAVTGGYQLFSDRCSLEVKVSCGEMPEGLMGPCPLVLSVGRKVCN